MFSMLKERLRRIVPRTIRSNVRSPVKTMRWLSTNLRFGLLGPKRYQMRSDWTLISHPYAYANSYSVHVADREGVLELDAFISTCTANMVFFDVGAHFGIFSLAAMRYGSGARVLAFDPSPMAERYVSLNARLNNYQDRLATYRVAIADRDKQEKFVPHGVFGAGYFSISDPKSHSERERTRVQCRSLDSIAAELNLAPTHLKVDVEGFEWEALLGARKVLVERRPRLFLEMHNELLRKRGIDPTQVLNLVEEYGYSRYTTLGRSIGKGDIVEHPIIRLVCER